MTQAAITFEDSVAEWNSAHHAVGFMGRVDGEFVPLEIDAAGLSALSAVEVSVPDATQMLSVYSEHVQEIQAAARREYDHRDRSERPIILSAADFIKP